MKILVANLGSTSFKFRLFDMSDEAQLARGAIERIGDGKSKYQIICDDLNIDGEESIVDHAAALALCLRLLQENQILAHASELNAIGFKAVHGGRFSKATIVDDEVLGAMKEMNEIAPAHNPIYVRAMRQMEQAFPGVPLVAVFETGFHRTNSPAQSHYSIPKSWHDDFFVRRWGFHGASHQFIAERMRQIAPDASSVIALHLGGSSSLCAIRDGNSVGTTMGMSPQTGLPQGNRCGDFDPFALPLLMKNMGKSLDEVLNLLANESGLLGLSGISADIRDLEQATANGEPNARLALDVYVSEIRRHMGGLIFLLGSVDAIAFTGGAGENSRFIRDKVCLNLEQFGIELDANKNQAAAGERRIDTGNGTVQVWTVPTNEEIIVARQTAQVLKG